MYLLNKNTILDLSICYRMLFSKTYIETVTIINKTFKENNKIHYFYEKEMIFTLLYIHEI